MSALRAVLFDLDGTLVDTSPLHDRAFRDALAAHAPDKLAGFDYAKVAGLTTDAVFASLGVDAGSRSALVDAKRAAFRVVAARDGIRAMPGAVELVASLRGRGVRVVVVTSAARASAEATLAAAGLAHDELVAAEDAPRGKPDPAPYLAALERSGAPADACLAVEDADAGVASARGAGLRVVRVHGDAPGLAALARDLDEALRRENVVVVPAAGVGSRLGTDAPKVLVELAPGVRVWDVLAARLAQVAARIHLVLSADGLARFDALGRPAPPGVTVTTSVQTAPRGMGDAVLGAADAWRDADRVVVVWGDQLGLAPATLDRALAAHRGAMQPALAVPLVEQCPPYVHYALDADGRLGSVSQSREGEPCPPVGRSDVGVFVLSPGDIEEAWRAWAATPAALGKTTRELNFLPFLAELSRRGFATRVVDVADAAEARGLNTPDDLAYFRARLS